MQTTATIQQPFTGIAGIEGAYPDFYAGQAERMRNFRIDNLGRLRRRDGYRHLCTLPQEVRAYCYGKMSSAYNDTLYYCTADAVYGYDTVSMSAIKLHDITVGEVWDPMTIFLLGGKLYLLGGGQYYRCDHGSLEEIQGYLPLRYRNVNPIDGKGEEKEAPNALTRLCRALYSPKENSSIFLLPEVATGVEWVKVGGQTVPFQTETGFYDPVRIQVALEISVPPSVESVEICYRDARADRRQEILYSPCAYRYGGSDDLRLFFYGNEGACVYYSADLSSHSDAPAYFPYDNCLKVGKGESPVTGIVRRYDHVLIHTATETFAAQRKDGSYRLYLVHDRIGCVGQGKCFELGKDSLTVSQDGVYRLKPEGSLGNWVAEKISDAILGKEDPQVLCNAQVVCDPIHKEVWFATGEVIWVYQYENKVWYQFDRPLLHRLLYFGSVCFEKDNVIYRYEGDCNTDLEEPILALWESAPFSPANARRVLREGAFCGFSVNTDAEVCLQVAAMEGGREIDHTEAEIRVPHLFGAHTVITPLHLPCAEGYRLTLSCTDQITVAGLGLRCGGQSWEEGKRG